MQLCYGQALCVCVLFTFPSIYSFIVPTKTTQWLDSRYLFPFLPFFSFRVPFFPATHPPIHPSVRTILRTYKTRRGTVHIYRRSEWQHHYFSLHFIGPRSSAHQKGRKGEWNHWDDSRAAACCFYRLHLSVDSSHHASPQTEGTNALSIQYVYVNCRRPSLGISILTYSVGLPATLQLQRDAACWWKKMMWLLTLPMTPLLFVVKTKMTYLNDTVDIFSLCLTTVIRYPTPLLLDLTYSPELDRSILFVYTE